MPITVAVIDNHDLVRDGLEQALAARPDVEMWGAYADVESLLADAGVPDVVVLDLYLGRDDTASTPAIGWLIGRGSRVVLHTAEERPVPLRAAVSAGASGVSLKNDGRDALLDVVVRVAHGDFVCSSMLARALVTDAELVAHLSPREVDILVGLDDGLTQHQVGRRLGIAEETVKTHLKSVRHKYLDLGRDVTNAASVVREATRDGWLG